MTYRNPKDPRIRARIEAGKRPVGNDWLEMSPVKNTAHQKRNHPCQLPEAMVEEIILGTTQPGDLVGDCYTGSGTTAICALRHGRSFSGCEQNPAYVSVAKQAIWREFGIGQPDQADKSPSLGETEKVEIRRVI